jgi:hypothetical protein
MSPPDAVISFTVPAAPAPSAGGLRPGRRVSRLRGLVRLEGPTLVIEWSGAVERTQVRGPEVRTTTEAIPATRREIPVERLVDVSVSGWWRPRFEVRAADLAALEGVPTADNGRASLRIARAERPAALSLVVSLREAMADAALRAAEGE